MQAGAEGAWLLRTVPEGGPWLSTGDVDELVICPCRLSVPGDPPGWGLHSLPLQEGCSLLVYLTRRMVQHSFLFMKDSCSVLTDIAVAGALPELYSAHPLLCLYIEEVHNCPLSPTCSRGDKPWTYNGGTILYVGRLSVVQF